MINLNLLYLLLLFIDSSDYIPRSQAIYVCNDAVIISLIDGDLLVMTDSAKHDFLRVIKYLEDGGDDSLQFLLQPIKPDTGKRLGVGLNLYDEYPEIRPGGYRIIFFFAKKEKARFSYDSNGDLVVRSGNNDSLLLTADKKKILDADEVINSFKYGSEEPE